MIIGAAVTGFVIVSMLMSALTSPPTAAQPVWVEREAKKKR
ncbi:MAG: hypothetical protein ABL967_02710 [Bryobacteraceae bacterium]